MKMFLYKQLALSSEKRVLHTTTLLLNETTTRMPIYLDYNRGSDCKLVYNFGVIFLLLKEF